MFCKLCCCDELFIRLIVNWKDKLRAKFPSQRCHAMRIFTFLHEKRTQGREKENDLFYHEGGH
jgi:hypothetical protein